MAPPDPKKSVPKSVSLVRNKAKKIEEYIEEFKEIDWSSAIEEEAKDLIKDMKECFNRLQVKWGPDELDEACDPKTKDSDELFLSIVNVEEEMQKCITRCKKWIERSKGACAEASNTREVSLRIEASFKPSQILTSSNNLEEFNSWRAQFQGHYKANEKVLRTHGAEFQQNFLYSCIDSKLQNALRTDESISQRTEIMGDDGLLAKLKAVFMKDYPLFVRRYNYSRCKQSAKEPFSEWWTKKKLKAQECELEKVTKDDVQLMELICGVYDSKLREEFLKIKEPTLVGLVEIAEQWQSASSIEKSLSSSSSTAYKTSDYKADKRSNWQ